MGPVGDFLDCSIISMKPMDIVAIVIPKFWCNDIGPYPSTSQVFMDFYIIDSQSVGRCK